MEYTVHQLAKLAGISSRTLRYYDQIGLLRPAKTTGAGYRIYTSQQVDRLQQILFYRELKLPLGEIASLLSDPGFDRLTALHGHCRRLLEERERIDALIHNLRRSIAALEGGDRMSDPEKFQGFKQRLVEQNEQAYGGEIRRKYGSEAVEESNRKLLGMNREQYARMQLLEQEVLRLLDEAHAQGDHQSDLARQLCAAHRKWLQCTWSKYSAEAHRNLAETYLADRRFADYYDRGVPGRTQFLRDVLVHCLEG